uniref:Uncharacterized protein n=1 Tax=Pavo cristatus TaxID=9049 RepID=A0A8C9FGN4_PAVCR
FLFSLVLGTKSAAEYANGAYDIVSPAPSVYLGTFQILHLLEDLKMALEMLEDPQEKEALRNQIPGATAGEIGVRWMILYPFACYISFALVVGILKLQSIFYTRQCW